MSEHFRFFYLPHELRQSVYELYLPAHLPFPTMPAQQFQDELQSVLPSCPIPLFLTSKKTNDEIPISSATCQPYTCE